MTTDAKPPRFAGMLNEADWTAIMDRVEQAVDRVLMAHGFKAPQSSTSVIHSMMATQEERERHTARLQALSDLLAEAKKAAGYYNGHGPRNRMLHAILAVEREFKQ